MALESYMRRMSDMVQSLVSKISFPYSCDHLLEIWGNDKLQGF